MTADMYIKAEKSANTIPVDTTSVPLEDLASGKPINVKCVGLSMYPLIKYNDILVIQPATTKDLSAGEIIFFRLSTGLCIIHRLISKTRENMLLLNGDSMRNLDDPVKEEQVLGRVTRIIHNGKTLNLEGTINKIVGWFIVKLARYRIPLQITSKQVLTRIQWMLCGKSIT